MFIHAYFLEDKRCLLCDHQKEIDIISVKLHCYNTHLKQLKKEVSCLCIPIGNLFQFKGLLPIELYMKFPLLDISTKAILRNLLD